MADKLKGYAFSMMLLQLSLVLLGLTEVYPFSLEIAGFDVYGDITETMTSIQTMFSGIAENGVLTSVAISGMVLLMGVKVVLEFALMVIVGTYPIMTAMGLPGTFALPISLFFGTVAIYGLAMKLLGRDG
ncbi:hypothetical protein FTO70_03880 [Methanosarcina sp. KYL-1]|uniref:hypothetical protein n=1 Tax=Methanosarcina sp. KYL-1 TaxID=2602068 RepID=UPI002101552C|nr:hypothetical protein [Methanosarcina sp. KYL-1]MCQ1534843.1 hypothetical protein [Methanosarcina sp. KYL-1]